MATVVNPERLLERGVKLARDGHDGQAESAFREAIQAKPDVPAAFLNLGVVLERQQRHLEAEQAFRHALDLQPDLAQGKLYLGISLEAQARYADAEQAYREAIQLDHGLAEAHLNLGVSLQRRDCFGAAEAAYRDALKLNPSLRPARLDLAGVLDQVGKLPEAEATYRAAITDAPDDPFGYLGLGLTLAKQKRYAEAGAAYREALRLKPDFRAAHSALALALDLQGQLEQAIEEYRRAVALPIDPTLADYRPEWDYFKLARTLTALGQDPAAEIACRAALALRPQFPEALVALADLLNRLGRPEHAEDHARQAVATPTDAWQIPAHSWKALATLAAVCIELGEKFNDQDQFDEALAEIESAQRQMPEIPSEQDGEQAALLSLLSGYVLAKLGRLGEAKSKFRSCAKEAPTNSAIALAAVRNERRLNARLRSRVDVPRWLPFAVSLVTLAAILGAAWRVQLGQLSTMEFLGSVGAGVVLVFAAFSLPALTQLKVGPAELQKETSIPTPPRLELLTGAPGPRVPAQGFAPDITLHLWAVATVSEFVLPGREIKPRGRVPGKTAPSERLAGRTPHFVISLLDHDEEAASVVLSACEQDYSVIHGWFGQIEPAGQPFKVILDPNAGGAYHMTCAATEIHVLPDRDLASGFLAAEVVEVFAANLANGWNCGRTNGEALARVLAFELHPTLARDFTGTEQDWWQSGHPDHITDNQAGDLDQLANGCGQLFLHFLHSKLGFGWEAIVRAGGDSLGETYRRLTGRPGTLGFSEFVQLLAGLERNGALEVPPSGDPFAS